jgi:hypothetical protein
MPQVTWPCVSPGTHSALLLWTVADRSSGRHRLLGVDIGITPPQIRSKCETLGPAGPPLVAFSALRPRGNGLLDHAGQAVQLRRSSGLWSL